MGKAALDDDYEGEEDLELEEVLERLPAELIDKSTRRRLEDRLEELQLRRELNEYEFEL